MDQRDSRLLIQSVCFVLPSVFPCSALSPTCTRATKKDAVVAPIISAAFPQCKGFFGISLTVCGYWRRLLRRLHGAVRSEGTPHGLCAGRFTRRRSQLEAESMQRREQSMQRSWASFPSSSGKKIRSLTAESSQTRMSKGDVGGKAATLLGNRYRTKVLSDTCQPLQSAVKLRARRHIAEQVFAHVHSRISCEIQGTYKRPTPRKLSSSNRYSNT